MTHSDVRRKYIDFFVKRGHKEIPSASLVPENDPSSLFTSSGMQPLITYLLGDKHPLGTRLVDSQKCFRAQDIEEIGDNRHTTFFEMLGNWSLGDYFKKNQLPWIFEFLTQELGLDPQRLYVTVFEGNTTVAKDTESINIWKEIFANVEIDAKVGERIFTYPAKKNWWSRSGEPENMPIGEPGGPDSEVFFDFGIELKLHERSLFASQKCHPNCDCGRFMEIANSVFMQYQKKEDGTLQELAQKNVDFGGGLERMVAAVNDDLDVFNTDLFQPIIKEIEEISQKSYKDEKNKEPMRIIADHIKAAVFLIVDGVEPSNKTQGYVVRRLLRRAAVMMDKLQGNTHHTPSYVTICTKVISLYKDIYFHDVKLSEQIAGIIDGEMRKFSQTLSKGLNVLEKISKPDGKTAFDLYQTYGFPLELTREILTQKGITINDEEFKTEFQKHQDLSRTSSKGLFKGGLQDQTEATTNLHTATHLLQQTLRDILGNHVRQKGSNITAERLRFDFSHSHKLTSEEISKVEKTVNKKIKENLKVSMEIEEFEKALKIGALTVEGATYPEKVKVYSVGNYSKEVCGGPHVSFTGSLGSFKIIKEEAISANIRRIYAILK